MAGYADSRTQMLEGNGTSALAREDTAPQSVPAGNWQYPKTAPSASAPPGGSTPKTAVLLNLWTNLISGTSVLIDYQYSDQRCFATVQNRHGTTSNFVLSNRDVLMLSRVLRGESLKSVAFDLRASVSTVATRCKVCLTAMGEPRPASRAFVLFPLLAHAARGVELRSTRFAGGEDSSGQFWTVSIERPDNRLPDCLTETERQVVRLVVEGRSHQAIAAMRRVSARTIANQLASVFKKLKVSGRAQLVAYLIQTS